MHFLYINLDRRTDRRKEFEDECAKMQLEVERFPGVPHRISPLGCGLAHMGALKLARERGYESVCIFEDDFEFLVNRPEFDTILANLPEDYDVVMLGWYVYHSLPYNDMFSQVVQATTASGYIVHSRFYDKLIQNLEEGAVLLEKNPRDRDIYINDQYWLRLQQAHNWYHTKNRVGHQRPSYSDLLRTFVRYTY